MECYYSVIPHISSKMSIEEFMPFEWDKKQQKIVESTLSKDELQVANQGALDFFKDLNININQVTTEQDS